MIIDRELSALQMNSVRRVETTGQGRIELRQEYEAPGGGWTQRDLDAKGDHGARPHMGDVQGGDELSVRHPRPSMHS